MALKILIVYEMRFMLKKHNKTDDYDVGYDDDNDLGWWTACAIFGVFCTITSIIGTIKVCQWVYLGIKNFIN